MSKTMRRANKDKQSKQAKTRRAERKLKALQREAYEWASLGY